MKKLTLRVLSACLCIAMVLPLAGCNKKKKEPRKRVVQETDPYFSCEDILLDFESPEGKVVERRAIGQIKIFSNCIVVETLETYVMPVEFKKQWSEYRENWLIGWRSLEISAHGVTVMRNLLEVRVGMVLAEWLIMQRLLLLPGHVLL